MIERLFSRSFQMMRVTPAPIVGRTLSVEMDDSLSAHPRSRDASSSWSCHISYLNAAGEASERRITCRKISGYGAGTHVMAYCHERHSIRSFRIDRIQELVDLSTGELLDPVQYFEMLRTTGALKVEDKGMLACLQILTFMAKCDGSYHPLEAEALEAAITAYALRFDGDDDDVEIALSRIPAIAPDGGDVMRAIRRLQKAPTGNKIARLVLDHCGRIIDADGEHHPEEIHWAMEIDTALKQMVSG